MIQWLKRLFRQPGRFKIPHRNQLLPKCRFRPFEDGDFDICTEIYRLNESGRFPAGYLEHFSMRLRNRGDLVLICEIAGEIRGFGGISNYQDPWTELAELNFGMIHPRYHRQGFGTALLLARLATLPAPTYRWTAFMSTAGGSESFYQRFGFRHFDRFADEHGAEFDNYWARVNKRAWQACRNVLAAASIDLATSDIIIPRISSIEI